MTARVFSTPPTSFRTPNDCIREPLFINAPHWRGCTGASVESTDVSKVDEALLHEVEADVYWCLTKLLDNIQVYLVHMR